MLYLIKIIIDINKIQENILTVETNKLNSHTKDAACKFISFGLTNMLEYFLINHWEIIVSSEYQTDLAVESHKWILLEFAAN